MSGKPWEKYAPAPEAAEAGQPWLKYAPAAPVEPAAPANVRANGMMGAGSALEAALIGMRQGVTLGFGDEINAGVRAAGDWMGGKEFGPAYDQRVAHERALLDQTRKEDGGAMLAGEIGGSVLLPGGAIKAATVPGAALRGAGTAAAFGAAGGAGNAEGGLAERVQGATEGAAWGSLFGAGAGALGAMGTKAFRAAMGRVAEKPSVEGLRVAKTAAYKAVDDAGEVFLPEELAAMAKAAREGVESLGNYVPDVDDQTRAALSILERNTAAPLSIGKLDKIRQGMWERLERSPKEVGIYEAIDAIDDLIQSRSSTSELMTAARMANSQYKRAELLEDAFKLAQDQTKATGSGGNILNKYKQAVVKIVNNPKKAKWFDGEQLAAMQKIIDGSVSEGILRRVGKVSPSGNGLMMMLNLLGASSMGPGFLAVSAVGAGAKELADRAGTGNVDALMGRVMGAAPPQPMTIPGMGAVGYSGSPK